MEFKVGDIVEWAGARGEVVRIHNGTPFQVIAIFDGDDAPRATFTASGKKFDWHKEPSLKLIERPKKMVQKRLQGWVNVYPDDYDGENVVCLLCVTKEEAIECANGDKVVHVYIDVPYEIEEEE